MNIRVESVYSIQTYKYLIHWFYGRYYFLYLYFFSSGCENESRLSMWIYVLLGNILRGIGETPVQPLGISYIDDHALEDNAAFYIGKKCLPFCYWFIVIHRHHLSERSLLDQKRHFYFSYANQSTCVSADNLCLQQNCIVIL